MPQPPEASGMLAICTALSTLRAMSVRRDAEQRPPGVADSRDLLAQWAGEELTALARAPAAVRAQHAARGRFYLDILRGGLPSGQLPVGAFGERRGTPADQSGGSGAAPCA